MGTVFFRGSSPESWGRSSSEESFESTVPISIPSLPRWGQCLSYLRLTARPPQIGTVLFRGSWSMGWGRSSSNVRLQSTVPNSSLLPFEVGTVLSWTPRAGFRRPALLPKALSPFRSSSSEKGTVLFLPPIEISSAKNGDSLLQGIQPGELRTVFIRRRLRKHCPHPNPGPHPNPVPSEVGTVFVLSPIDGPSAPDRDSPFSRMPGDGMGTVFFGCAPPEHCPQFNPAPF